MMTTEEEPVKSRKSHWLVKTGIRYVSFYLLGVVCCVIFTPVELELAGAPLGFLYPILAPIGYPLFYLLEPQYVYGSTPGYWALYASGIASVFLGIISLFVARKKATWLAPALIGFTIGFVGTMGIYYTAAQSI